MVTNGYFHVTLYTVTFSAYAISSLRLILNVGIGGVSMLSEIEQS